MNNRRSRNRSNNNRRGGNNQGYNNTRQTFDSNGPEGKVRGNPAQIFEKYQSMARDALASGDLVKAQNFFQHAEHYYRVGDLGAAERRQREQQVQEEAQAQQDTTSDAGEAPPVAEKSADDLAPDTDRADGFVDLSAEGDATMAPEQKPRRTARVRKLREDTENSDDQAETDSRPRRRPRRVTTSDDAATEATPPLQAAAV